MVIITETKLAPYKSLLKNTKELKKIYTKTIVKSKHDKLVTHKHQEHR